MKHIEGIANHVGLFSEEYDMTWREALGNFPQAFTHIGYINSVVALRQARGKTAEEAQREERKPRLSLLLQNKIVLNGGNPGTTYQRERWPHAQRFHEHPQGGILRYKTRPRSL